MKSKYVDTTAIVQVIGNVFNSPKILDYGDKYSITENDFVEDFHKIVFGSIYKLYELGAKEITIENICDFLSSRPKSEAIFKKEKGEEWLLKASEQSVSTSFDYYYNRMKKMSLLRAYDNYGIDVSFIYDPEEVLDFKKKQRQEEQLDGSSLEAIALKIENVIEKIRYEYVGGEGFEEYQAGDGIEDLLENLKKHPEVGVPMYGSLINTVTRGARLGKFYLRSAPTGVGKSRTMIADICNFACDMIYYDDFGWVWNGTSEPCLYITTEQDLGEVQTMMLAFLSNVEEDHILNGWYQEGEEARVLKAAEILKRSPLRIEVMHDFSLQDVENRIKRAVREYDVRYVGFDYIHTSLKILEEISRRSGGVKIREDNVLFMLSARLKDICNQYGIFILSSTQLNGDYAISDTPDQNLLRGAKSIADRIDLGMILLPAKQQDIESLTSVLGENGFEKPNLKLSIYKNRRGKYKGVYLWCRGNLGTCRVEPLFMTGYDYELIYIDDFKIEVGEKHAF